jgi:hypothetical protein
MIRQASDKDMGLRMNGRVVGRFDQQETVQYDKKCEKMAVHQCAEQLFKHRFLYREFAACGVYSAHHSDRAGDTFV